ncbi:MAG: hypothetical protein RSE58_07705 [Clostridia bacterium]
MRRCISAITALILLVCSCCSALAESKYVSIKDIRETIPERWTGDYIVKKGNGKQLKKGDTVSIDAPIVVPEVDAVPVVRITWGGPLELAENPTEWELYENNANGIWFNHLFDGGVSAETQYNADIGTISYEDAPSVYLSQLRKLCPAVPYNQTYGCISAQDPQQYAASVCAPKEIDVDAEDVPLLPFDEILKVFGKMAEEGHIYSLDEVRFGYMVFIDPEKKGEEYVLMPVWAAKGRTNGDPTIPFDLKTSQDVLDYNGYNDLSRLVVNAQTGETYDFIYDTSPDRRYIPDIITWDDVK